MNKANVELAIKVMERVRDAERKFYMGAWQWQIPEELTDDLKTVATEFEAVECGMACCFGGWLSLSPEWKAQGGGVDMGVPSICRKTGSNRKHYGADAVAVFLGIPDDDAEVLTATYETDEDGNEAVYDKPMAEITPQDVINMLHVLKERGTLIE